MSSPLEPSLSVGCYNQLCSLFELWKAFSSIHPVESTLHHATYLSVCLKIAEHIEEVVHLDNDLDPDRTLAVEYVESFLPNSTIPPSDKGINYVLVLLHPCGFPSGTAVVPLAGCRPSRGSRPGRRMMWSRYRSDGLNSGRGWGGTFNIILSLYHYL